MIAGDAFQQDRRLFGFGVGHAGGGLIDQQQIRLLHQQHADLQPLFLAVAERSGVGEAGLFEGDNLHHLVDAVGLRARKFEQKRGEHIAPAGQGQFQIIEDGVVLKHGGFLKLAADAQIGDARLVQAREVRDAVEQNLAPVGPGLACHHVHHGCLAGAVGPDDGAQLAGQHIKAKVVERHEAVEADGDAIQIKDRVRRLFQR